MSVVNERGSSMYNRNYALNLAAQQGNLEKVKHMIEVEGVSVNGRSDIICNNGFPLNQSTALHQACQGLNANVVRYLLENGADANAKAGDEEYTPLHAVALCGAAFDGRDSGNMVNAREIVNMLLEKQGDPFALTQKCADGIRYTPVDFANTHGLPSVRNAINNFLSKSERVVSKQDGICSLQTMSEDDIQQVVDLLTHLIKLHNPEDEINNNRSLLQGPIRLFYDQCDRVIVIEAMDYSRESTDLPYEVYEVLSAIPKKIINYLTTPSESRTGFGGMDTYTGRKCIVAQADVDKLAAHRDLIVNSIQEDIKKAKSALDLATMRLSSHNKPKIVTTLSKEMTECVTTKTTKVMESEVTHITKTTKEIESEVINISFVKMRLTQLLNTYNSERGLFRRYCPGVPGKTKTIQALEGLVTENVDITKEQIIDILNEHDLRPSITRRSGISNSRLFFQNELCDHPARLSATDRVILGLRVAFEQDNSANTRPGTI